jgi:hypothetical protein
MSHFFDYTKCHTPLDCQFVIFIMIGNFFAVQTCDYYVIN